MPRKCRINADYYKWCIQSYSTGESMVVTEQSSWKGTSINYYKVHLILMVQDLGEKATDMHTMHIGIKNGEREDHQK